jgi:hypothetical protein
VTQAVLVEGRNRVRIHEPSREAPPGFEPAVPTLEDAYFVLMHAKRDGAASEVTIPPISTVPGITPVADARRESVT